MPPGGAVSCGRPCFGARASSLWCTRGARSSSATGAAHRPPSQTPTLAAACNASLNRHRLPGGAAHRQPSYGAPAPNCAHPTPRPPLNPHHHPIPPVSRPASSPRTLTARTSTCRSTRARSSSSSTPPARAASPPRCDHNARRRVSDRSMTLPGASAGGAARPSALLARGAVQCKCQPAPSTCPLSLHITELN